MNLNPNHTPPDRSLMLHKRDRPYLADFHPDDFPVAVTVPVHHVEQERVLLLREHFALYIRKVLTMVCVCVRMDEKRHTHGDTVIRCLKSGTTENSHLVEKSEASTANGNSETPAATTEAIPRCGLSFSLSLPLHWCSTLTSQDNYKTTRDT